MTATTAAAGRTEELDAHGLDAALDDLVELLHRTVVDGASIGFVLPFAPEGARAFWLGVRAAVAERGRVLLVSRDGSGRVVGTVQVVLSMPANGRHRADVVKLMVHPRARRQGRAEQLMRAAEQVARRHRRTLLVLDTRTGDVAEQLYARLGYRTIGVIPDYCRPVGPGALQGTTVMALALPAPVLDGPIEVAAASPSAPDAVLLLDELSALLASCFGADGRAGWDGGAGTAGWDADDPRQVFALARVGGVPVGCGAIRPAEGPDRDDAAELLRMYSAVGGLGTGRAVLEFLQDAARRARYRSLRLETRRANTPAVAFYLRHGYAEREPYGRHAGRPEAICLQKDL